MSRYNIDFLDSTSRESLIIDVMQGDTARTLEFVPNDYTIPSGATATYYVKRPSNIPVYNTATISGNVVSVKLTAQALAEKGINHLYVRLTISGEYLTSFAVVLNVKEFGGVDAVESSTEMNVFDQAVAAALDDFEAEAEAVAAEVIESIPADYTELTEKVGDLDDLQTSSKSDLVSAINEIASGTNAGLTDDIKQALLQIAAKVAYIDDDGQDYYSDLHDALYPPIPATAISLSSNNLSFSVLNTTQTLTATLTPSDATDEVEWSSSDTSVATVSDAGVVTSVAYGSALITATAGSVSATCSVVIAQATLSSISAVYTQSGTVYDTDSLDTLKSGLVVTASWSNSTTSTVASTDYTLSGTLATGTSTITVSYGGKTDTFTVTVTHNDTSIYNWDFTQSLTDTKQQAVATIGEGVAQSSSGLTFSGGTTSIVYLANMSTYATSSYTVELDVTTWNAGTILLSLATSSSMSAKSGIRWNASKWRVYDTGNSWKDGETTSTDSTVFNGKTLKFQCDYQHGTWTIYAGDTLVLTASVLTKSNGRNSLGIGSSDSTIGGNMIGIGTVITGCRIYEGIV